MNEYDSAILDNLMRKEGFIFAGKPEKADIIIINTCSVRGKPEQKGIDVARYYKKRGRYVVLMGCTAQQKGEELLKVADLVVGTRNFQIIPEVIKKGFSGKAFLELKTACNFSFNGRSVKRVLEYVVIQEGCDNFCSYCVVPYTRGREYSRSPEEIIEELRYAEERGALEVTLLGQNVNSYYYKGVDFADLLQIIDRNTGIPRVYFTTSHPRDMSVKVIEVVRNAEHIKPWFHLPLQSGSTKVLRDMNRGYTKEEYLQLADFIRKKIPSASITTDLMVGFPTETEEDFEQTLDVVRKVKFDNAYMFIYSPRNPSPAYFKYRDRSVDEDVAGKRLRKLISEVNRNIYERRKEMIGKEYEILIYGPSRKSSKYSKGKTENNITVVVPGNFKEGEFVRVRIERIIGLTPIGELVSVKVR